MRAKKQDVKAIYPAIFGVGVIILGLLLVLPGTGWLVRYQIKTLIGPPTDLVLLLKDVGVKDLPGVDLDVAPEVDVMANVALDHSYPEQLNAALSAPQGAQVGMLVALSRHCSGAERVETLAHALRYETMSSYLDFRDDEVYAFWGDQPSARNATVKEMPRSQFDLFDSLAAEGEQLDPNNAYFPMMRAVALIAAHRDSEGLEAIRRAATKPKFEDYVTDEAKFRLAHLERRSGRQTSMATLMVIGSTLYPHYARLRSVARFVAYSAAKSEQAGRNEEGFVLRRAMMRCGSMMRVQSHSIVGSLVGIAIVPICIQTLESQYGGIGKTAWKALTNDQRRRRREEIYTAHLVRIGHREEMPWVLQEMAWDDETKEISKEGLSRGPMGLHSLGVIFRAFGGTLFLLSNAIELLLLCGAMWLCKGNRTAERIALILLLLVFVVCGFRMQWAPAMTGMYEVATNLSEPSPALGGITPSRSVFSLLGRSTTIVRGAAIFGCLIGPLFALVVLAIMRLARREEEQSVVGSGLRRGGAVIALILLGSYAMTLTGVIRDENELRESQLRMMQAEGPYYAELVGKPWPPAPVQPVGGH